MGCLLSSILFRVALDAGGGPDLLLRQLKEQSAQEQILVYKHYDISIIDAILLMEIKHRRATGLCLHSSKFRLWIFKL